MVVAMVAVAMGILGVVGMEDRVVRKEDMALVASRPQRTRESHNP